MILAPKKSRDIAVEIFSVTAILLLAFTASCAKVSTRPKVKAETQKAKALPHPQVHFPFDNDEVFLKELGHIDVNVQWLKSNKDTVVILEGHCDEHGPSSYNMELGDRRARTVKSHLIERGVSHHRIIMVVSFGENRPIDPNHNFDAWKMNRRVEFILR